jgi:predicted dehydrogenase
MRILIVGLGSIGERYVRNLLALGHTDIAVVRRVRRPPRTVSENSFETYVDLRDALETKPQAVIVANPTSLHVPVALAAVRTGAHVLMEIPLASSFDQVAELRDAADRRGSIVLMGHNLRFHPCLLKLKEIVDRQTLGPPVFARAEFGEYLPGCHPWEDYREGYAARRTLGGGAVLTSIHEVDFLYWMLGPVTEIAAMAGYAGGLEMDVEDTAAILMRHAAGAISEVHLDFIQPTYSRGCKIVGRDGAAQWQFRENRVLMAERGRQDWSIALELGDFDFNRTYLDELRHFVRCVEGTATPVNDLEQGIEILRLGLAALESSASRAFVAVSSK